LLLPPTPPPTLSPRCYQPSLGRCFAADALLGLPEAGTQSPAVYTGNAIEGNLIGLDATGTSSLPNAGVGISSAAGNQIGGTASGARNVVSANGDAGIFFIGAGTAGNQVQGNYIGTDSRGALARGNLFKGIFIWDRRT
jgi:hypothetical protein